MSRMTKLDGKSRDLILAATVRLCVRNQQRQLVCLHTSSELVGGAISFASNDRSRRILVEGHAPDDLLIAASGILRSCLQMTRRVESTSKVGKKSS